MREFVNEDLGISNQFPDEWTVQVPPKPNRKVDRRRSQTQQTFDPLSAGELRLIISAAKVRQWGGTLEVNVTLSAMADDSDDPRGAFFCDNAADLAWTKTHGVSQIDGLEVLYVDSESPDRNPKDPNDVVAVRFAFWHLRPNLWVHARIWGTNRKWFEKGVAAFETLRRKT